MSYIGKNIKKIRSVKKLSQSQFAEIFGMNRGNIGAYEEERADPKIDMIIQMAHYFGLSVDLLLAKELSVNDLYSFNILNKKLDRAHHFDVTESESDKKPIIKWLKLDRQLEYLVNYASQDFLSKLPTVDLPVMDHAEYLAFDMEGSEMEYNQNGLHHGDILLGSKCEVKSSQLAPGGVYVVVTSQGIKTRRLRSVLNTQLEFTSDDPNYNLWTVPTESVLQMWLVVGVYSTYLNPPRMLEERVMLIEDELRRMKEGM